MTLPENSLELWAACALPGDGPEYRFTAPHPRTWLTIRLGALWSLLRVRPDGGALMLIAYLLLGGFVVFITACLLIAARRGLWLMVEVDQRVHTEHTVVQRHEVAHHHHLHRPGRTYRGYAEPLPVARATAAGAPSRTVLSRAVLPRRTPQQLPAHTTEESP